MVHKGLMVSLLMLVAEFDPVTSTHDVLLTRPLSTIDQSARLIALTFITIPVSQPMPV